MPAPTAQWKFRGVDREVVAIKLALKIPPSDLSSLYRRSQVIDGCFIASPFIRVQRFQGVATEICIWSYLSSGIFRSLAHSILPPASHNSHASDLHYRDFLVNALSTSLTTELSDGEQSRSHPTTVNIPGSNESQIRRRLVYIDI